MYNRVGGSQYACESGKKIAHGLASKITAMQEQQVTMSERTLQRRWEKVHLKERRRAKRSQMDQENEPSLNQSVQKQSKTENESVFKMSPVLKF